jgi:hypothetical protein
MRAVEVDDRQGEGGLRVALLRERAIDLDGFRIPLPLLQRLRALVLPIRCQHCAPPSRLAFRRRMLPVPPAAINSFAFM